MRRILLWFVTTLGAVVLLFGYRTSTSSIMPTTTISAATPAAGSSAGTAPAPATSGGTPPPGGSTITGTAADTRWGPVQVRITVAGGRLTAVDVVEYPTGSSRDRSINARAVPVLVQETLQAQSTNIDMVSGATVTSGGFVRSLQSALDQAGVS